MRDYFFLFPLMVPIMLIAIMFVFAKLGWSKLEKVYRFDGLIEGKQITYFSAKVNFVSYNGCLIASSNEFGMYLKTALIFKLFHPRLFMPWDDMIVNEGSKLFGGSVVLKFKQVNNVKIEISNKIYKRLIDY